MKNVADYVFDVQSLIVNWRSRCVTLKGRSRDHLCKRSVNEKMHLHTSYDCTSTIVCTTYGRCFSTACPALPQDNVVSPLIVQKRGLRVGTSRLLKNHENGLCSISQRLALGESEETWCASYKLSFARIGWIR